VGGHPLIVVINLDRMLAIDELDGLAHEPIRHRPGRPLGLWAGNIPRFGSLPAVNQSGVHYRVAKE